MVNKLSKDWEDEIFLKAKCSRDLIGAVANVRKFRPLKIIFFVCFFFFFKNFVKRLMKRVFHKAL